MSDLPVSQAGTAHSGLLCRFWVLLLLAVCVGNAAFSQQKKDSTNIGTVKGILWDSAHNYVLKSATLAVYKAEDSSLISYQLTNNFGEFNIKQLPIGVQIRVVASFIGYQDVSKTFTIEGDNGAEVDLKKIDLKRGENALEDVVVKSIPPVRMNGDTLEFNGDAFKMDPNVTAEEWMRRLPGVVIWGDGTITVNGREVDKVLVNGKPFFGGDSKIATQNLPKEAVEKVQVYHRDKGPNNPLDSTTEINIKLKENKSTGYFGKLAAGYGTDKLYEADGNLNFYNKKTQLGVVGASNNINKLAGDVATLMNNSTYQGVGANIEYQSDFRMQGLNKANAGGVTFQHDFIEKPDYYNENRLVGWYFIQNKDQQINRHTRTITTLGQDSTQLRDDNSQSKAVSTGQRFSASYNKHKDNNTYKLAVGFTTTHSNNHNAVGSNVSNGDDILQSSNNASSDQISNSRSVDLSAGLVHTPSFYVNSLKPQNLTFDYSFSADDGNSRGESKTEFISIADPSQNKTVNRLHNNSNSSTQHNLNMKIGSFSNWLLPRFMRSISIDLKNNLTIRSQHQNNRVQDWDTLSGKYTSNAYLSGSLDYTRIIDKPALAFQRSFFKGLANRYNKSLSLGFDAQWQLYHQKNTSSHSFQNITQSYQKFIPQASISYVNNQYGAFMDNYTLSFITSSGVPTIGQLAPLVDSSNQYNIRQGNMLLKPFFDQRVTFSFRHTKSTPGNALNYNLNVTAGVTSDAFVDSSNTDSLGRSSYYTVNADGRKYLNGSGILNKSFQWGSHQLQLELQSSVSLARNPSFVNGLKIQSNGFNNSNSLKVYYRLKDNLAVNMAQGYSIYRSKQVGTANGYSYKHTNQYTQLSASYKITRKLTVRSNITYNQNHSSGSAPVNFTIWNANASYRFLKGNNLELKFSALDLLHQNTSVINYGSNNILTHGTVNVLQNYYMLTVSFFPRQFGKKEKK